MKKHILFFTMILILSSCEKLQVQDDLPILEFFGGARNIAPTSVELTAQIIESVLSIDNRGFCWSKNPMPTLNDSSLVGESFSSNGNSYFNTKFRNLEPGTTYYFRAYASTVQGTGYSEDLIVEIPAISIPSCEIEANKITYNSSFINYDDIEITQYGEEFIIDASYYQKELLIKFHGVPETSEYSTQSWGNVVDINRFFECAILVDPIVPGLTNPTYRADYGQTVYVEVLDNNQYKVEFCDLKMTYSNAEDILISGHIIASL